MCHIHQAKAGAYVRLCDSYLRLYGPPTSAVRDTEGSNRRVFFAGEPPLRSLDTVPKCGNSDRHYFQDEVPAVIPGKRWVASV